MSCKHGNWAPCDECDELEEQYARGYAEGKLAAVLAEAADEPSSSMPVDSQIDFTAEIARLVKLSDALRANERRLIDDLESALASATQSPSECRHCGFMVKLNETPISSSDMNVEANVALLRDRAAVGFKKYGVTTERVDLSQADWIQHTIEELLDAANYLQAMKAKEV